MLKGVEVHQEPGEQVRHDVKVSQSKSVRRGAIALMLGSAAEAVAPILLVVILVRLLPPSELGTIQWFMMLVGLGSTLCAAGVPQVHMYFLPRTTAQLRKRYLVNAAFAQLLSGTIILAATLFGIQKLKLVSDVHGMVVSYTLLGAAMSLAAIFVTLKYLAAAAEGYRASVYGSLLYAALLTCIPSLVAYTTHDIQLVVTSIPLIYLVAACTQFFLNASGLRSDGHATLEWKSIKQVLVHSLPLGLSNAASELNRRADNILVGGLFPASDFAQYSIGAREVPIVPIIAYSFTQAILPSLGRMHQQGDRKGFIALWHSAIARTAWVVFPAFAILWIYSRELITWMFTPAYAGAVPVFQVYLLLLPLRLTAYGAVLATLEGGAAVSAGAVAGVICNVGIGFVLAVIVGWPSVAWSSLVAHILMMAIYQRHIQTRLGIMYWETLPFRQLARIAALVIGLTPVLLLGLHFGMPSIFSLLLCTAVFSMLYVLVSIHVGFISWRDMAMLKIRR